MNWAWVRFLQTLEGVAALLITVGLAALAFDGFQALEARRMAGWPAVPGRVVVSEIAPLPFPGRMMRNAPAARIVYEYAVDGVAFTGERVGLPTRPVEAESEEGRRRLQAYPAGAAVTVYHDPADPATAVLERDPPDALFVAGSLAIGAGVVVAAARRLLRRRAY